MFQSKVLVMLVNVKYSLHTPSSGQYAPGIHRHSTKKFKSQI